MILICHITFAQIINIKNAGRIPVAAGQIYKDLDNILDAYVGTWLYTDGKKSLKIVLIKKVDDYNGRYTEDYLYGAYEYKENGVILVSTLNDLTSNFTRQLDYSIWGRSVMKNINRPPCTQCAPNELRLGLNLNDPISNIFRTCVVRNVSTATENKIMIDLFGAETVYYKEGDPEPNMTISLPSGEYILIKI